MERYRLRVYAEFPVLISGDKVSARYHDLKRRIRGMHAYLLIFEGRPRRINLYADGIDLKSGEGGVVVVEGDRDLREKERFARKVAGLLKLVPRS